MRLLIWSDYACPYCYIGKRYLEQALAEFEHAGEIEIVFKAFELNHAAARNVVDTTQQRIEFKYGKSPAAAREMIERIMTMGTRVGLEMRYDTVRYTNTFDAHRLAKFAAEMGAGTAMAERLFRAYFTENRELSDIATLTTLAVEVGLGEREVAEVLASERYAVIVRSDEAEAARLGIHGVPFFAFDEETVFSGAHPKESLLKALRESYTRSKASPSGSAPSCDTSGCAGAQQG